RSMGADHGAAGIYARVAGHPPETRSPAVLQSGRVFAALCVMPSAGDAGSAMKLAFFGHKPQPGEKGGGLYNYSLEILRGLRARSVDVVFLYHGPRTRKRCDAKETQMGSLNVSKKGVTADLQAQILLKEALR